MARRTFFSFHYKPDVQRAWVVRNSQFFKEQGDSGFFDSSAFERMKNTDPNFLKRFLRQEIEGSSVVCALIGKETAERRWVRFELLQALFDGRGLLGVRVHGIGDWDGKPSAAGPNPFDLLGVYSVRGELRVIERAGVDQPWTYTHDFGQQLLGSWPYSAVPPADGNTALSHYFRVHDWTDGSHTQIGSWVEAAAVQAKR